MIRRPFTRSGIAAMVAAVVLSVLLGCGSNSGNTRPFDTGDWSSVESAARGTTVNWYVWGGSDAINRFIDETYAPALEERFDITLNRVPVADTVDAVNQVLSEKQAGVESGAVDLIWINGENFSTLKQADMLRKEWARSLPNARLVDWGNPALARDFGVPVDNMESPWSSAQLQLIHHPDRIAEDEVPRSYAEFAEWACAHPGRATYIAPGPGGFVGTRFIKGSLYEVAGGPSRFADFTDEIWSESGPRLWKYLSDLAPCLWREGATYPRDENQLHSLFANDEIDFSLTQAIAGPDTLIDAGTIPSGSRTFVFDSNMIGDYNYVAIPSNAPNPAAALVLANLILDPQMQAAHVRPQSGFGLGLAIDPKRIEDGDHRAAVERAAAERGPRATPVDDLAAALAPDSDPRYQDVIEREWRTHVLGSR